MIAEVGAGLTRAGGDDAGLPRRARLGKLAPTMELLFRVLLAYLLGSVNGALLVGRLAGGVDIRTQGSGNAGGTNALRTQGPAFALAVIVIDIAKGWLASAWLGTAALPWSGTAAAVATRGRARPARRRLRCRPGRAPPAVLRRSSGTSIPCSTASVAARASRRWSGRSPAWCRRCSRSCSAPGSS